MAREQIHKYKNTDFFDTTIVDIAPRTSHVDHFVITDQQGREWKGSTVVLATGLRDVLPDLEGYAENWAVNMYVFQNGFTSELEPALHDTDDDVLKNDTDVSTRYHCPFCDGWERRSLDKGILCMSGFDSNAAHLATMAHNMSSQDNSQELLGPEARRSKVTIFANGSPDLESDASLLAALQACSAHRMHIDTRKVLKLAADTEKDGLYIHLQNPDGTVSVTHRGFLFHSPRTVLVAPHLYEQLGLKPIETPYGEIVQPRSPMYDTEVSGVFIAGDAATNFTHVTHAMYSGMVCAASVASFCDGIGNKAALDATAGSSLKT